VKIECGNDINKRKDGSWNGNEREEVSCRKYNKIKIVVDIVDKIINVCFCNVKLLYCDTMWNFSIEAQFEWCFCNIYLLKI
jgi:hypothetical protein